jgi:hypothetical protein
MADAAGDAVDSFTLQLNIHKQLPPAFTLTHPPTRRQNSKPVTHVSPSPSYHSLMDGPDDNEKQKPSVHYTTPLIDSINLPPSREPSRPPSLAGTDEEDFEDEDYDWSGEEDLVDQEAKFEERITGEKRLKPWGFKR